MTVKLHLGCGSRVPEGWINVDYSLGARLAKLPLLGYLLTKTGLLRTDWNNNIFLHDLRKPFPFEDGSADFIYTSHTLEHLSREEGKLFLAESYRVLKKNGVLRVVVPDLKAIILKYQNGNIKADELLDHLYTSYEEASDSFIKRALAPYIRFPHKCMYDEERLVMIMNDIGFNAKLMPPFKSEIVNIEEVETESRTIEAVIVEGKK